MIKDWIIGIRAFAFQSVVMSCHQNSCETMNQKDSTAAIQVVPITQIETEDGTFATAPGWIVNEALRRSIERIGLTTPLLLQRHSGSRLRIVCGFQRQRLAASVGLKTVPALVTEEENRRKLFDLALFENLGTRELSELEKALAVTKLVVELGISEEELISSYLPALGVRPDRFHYKRCTAIARLPLEIQRNLSMLRVEIALKLARWTTQEQQLFLDLTRDYRPSRSYQKRLFGLLDDLRARGIQQEEAAPLLSIWNATGCSSLHEEGRAGDAVTFREILERLHQSRYPEFEKMVSRYEASLRALSFPRGVRVSPPPFFEGNSLAFEFSVQSPDQLATVAKSLGKAARRPEMADLFDLL